MNLFSISGTIALDANPAIKAMTVGIGLAAKFADEITELGVSAVKVSADFESTRNSLAVFAGGVNLAKQELAEIDKVARNTAGLRMESAEKGYVQLRNLGFQAETTKNLIAGLAKERLLSNADEQSVQRVIVNLTQISSSTARFSQDFKEMIHSMPTLRTAFADAFKTLDPQKLKKMFDADSEGAMKKLAQAMADAQGASGGLNDAIGKLEDAWIQAGKAFGEPLLDELTQDTKIFSQTIYDNMSTFEEWGERVTNIIRGVRKVAQDLNDEKTKKSPAFQALDLITTYSPLRHLDGVTKFSPLRLLGGQLEDYGAKDSLKNVPISVTGDLETLKGHKNDVAEMVKREKMEEEMRKSSITQITNYKDVVSNLYKNLYSVEDARLSSHLNLTLNDEIRSINERQTAKSNYLNNEIRLQTNGYDKLIALEKDDKDKANKLKTEKNKKLSDLNSELAISEYNSARQIREKEKQILDQRRQDLIDFKNFSVQEIQGNLENVNLSIRKQIEGSDSTNGFGVLINEYNSAFQKITQIVKEQYALQLQKQDLTAQQRINLEKQMNLELQKMARDNSRAILQIQEEQIQKITGQIDSLGQRIKSFRDSQVQLSQTIFDSAFGGNNLTKSGIDKYLKSFNNTESYETLKDVLTASARQKLSLESSVGADQIDLTAFNKNSLREEFKNQPDVLKQKLIAEDSYLKSFLANNTKIQDDLLNSIIGIGSAVDKEVHSLQLTGDKLNEAYKNIFAGGFTAESIDKLNIEKIKIKFSSQIDDLTGEIQSKIAGIESSKGLIEKELGFVFNFKPSQSRKLNDGTSRATTAQEKDDEVSQQKATSSTNISRWNEAIAKSQSEINALLRQRTQLTQESAQAEQQAWSTSIAGLQEYLSLLQNGDPFIKAQLANQELTRSLQEQIASYERISTMWKISTEDITGGITKSISQQQSLNQTIVDGVMSIPNVFTSAISQSNGTIQGFFKSIALGFAGLMKDIAAQLIKIAILQAILGIAKSVAGAFGGGAAAPGKGLIDSLIPGGGFNIGNLATGATGGIVTGGIKGKDSVNALLMPDEYVNNVASVQYYGAGFFEALNQKAIPKDFLHSKRLATGGLPSGDRVEIFRPDLKSFNSNTQNNSLGSGGATTNIYNQSVNQTIHAPRGLVAPKSARQAADAAMGGLSRFGR